MGSQDNMSSQALAKILGFFDRFQIKTKTGPYSREYKKLMLHLSHGRNWVLSEKDPQVRAFLVYCLGRGNISRAQIFQDAFALYALGDKREGFFCDFGATNGVTLSNSYALEHHFGWRGICAEPARGWHEAFRRNRPNTILETRCVWSQTGRQMTFMEAQSGELSTLDGFNRLDGHARHRRGARSYEVDTISLTDMLNAHQAPLDFDFLSMDTEGSELAILQTFDLKCYCPKVITIEHNYTPNRHGIFDLLTGHGYRRVLPEISLFDDWYLAPGITLPEP